MKKIISFVAVLCLLIGCIMAVSATPDEVIAGKVGYAVWNTEGDCVEVHFISEDAADFAAHYSNFKAIAVAKEFTVLQWDDDWDGNPEDTGSSLPIQMSGDLTVDGMDGVFKLHAGHQQTVANVRNGNHTFGGDSLVAYAEKSGGDIVFRFDGTDKNGQYTCYYLPIYDPENVPEDTTAEETTAAEDTTAAPASDTTVPEDTADPSDTDTPEDTTAAPKDEKDDTKTLLITIAACATVVIAAAVIIAVIIHSKKKSNLSLICQNMSRKDD